MCATDLLNAVNGRLARSDKPMRTLYDITILLFVAAIYSFVILLFIIEDTIKQLKQITL